MESQEDSTSMLIAVDLARDPTHFDVSAIGCGILALASLLGGWCWPQASLLFLDLNVAWDRSY